MRFAIIVALLALSAVGPARAFTANEAKLIVSAGGEMTLDTRFGVEATKQLVASGTSRITVVGRGFSMNDLKQWQGYGIRIVVDASMPLPDVTLLCRAGGIRTLIAPGGFTDPVLKQLKSYGCPQLPGDGGSTFEDKMRTLKSGQEAVATSSLPAGLVLQLAQVGRVKLHVIAQGFPPADVRQFVTAGAIVWVDSSLPTPEVTSMARAGGRRLIVFPSSFTVAALQEFARSAAQICFAFDGGARTAARSETFSKLQGENP